MARFDYKCPKCGCVWEVLTTVMHSTACSQCGAEGEKQFSGTIRHVVMLDWKNMDEGERELAMDHKADLERGVASGEYDITIQGPHEFRPEIPKRLY